ncbi:uncharacterized protein BDZ83DRAFT_31874 [Colletotrichum acutatum]|uniref:Uncharacterized protein n=1 Tax=Glomerella acutata TaxID=27357 RepID=A0AAD8XL71_GLOAC|nr:uncharacterized protein BDZ83DRAFT_31874 [Colletotrichum acutatum]KAK1729425.1 hypothetical protein BDZ83DRAFT_31874 [Colletotrichum acutatum]
MCILHFKHRIITVSSSKPKQEQYFPERQQLLLKIARERHTHTHTQNTSCLYKRQLPSESARNKSARRSPSCEMAHVKISPKRKPPHTLPRKVGAMKKPTPPKEPPKPPPWTHAAAVRTWKFKGHRLHREVTRPSRRYTSLAKDKTYFLPFVQDKVRKSDRSQKLE